LVFVVPALLSPPTSPAPAGPVTLNDWRERILVTLLNCVLALGALVAIPSMILAWHQGLPQIAVIDMLALGLVALLRTGAHRWSLTARTYGLLALSHTVAICLLLQLGPVAQVYLLPMPVLAVVLLGPRHATWSLPLNLLTMLLVGLWAPMHWPEQVVSQQPTPAWWVITANFALINGVITLTVALLLKGLADTQVRLSDTICSLQQGQQALEAAHQLTALNSSALARLTDMVLITSQGAATETTHQIVFVNNAFERGTGYSAAEVLGRSPDFLWQPQPSAAAMDLVSHALHQRQPLSTEVLLHRRDDLPLWVALDITPVIAEHSGETTHLVCVQRDVSERRRAEAALRASEESLQQIASQVPGVVYRLHIGHDGQRSYRYISPGVTTLYEVTPEEVLNHPKLLESFRHPDDAERVDTELRRSRQGRKEVSLEFRIVLASGQEKWIQVTSSVPIHVADGLVRVGVILDITERHHSEQALRDSEARWQLALESAGDGVWDWYPQTGVEIFSRRFKEMYGFSDDELPNLAQAMDGRTHPDDVPAMVQARQDHIEGRTATYINEHRVLCKDGSWKWVLSRGMVIARDAQGLPLRMIGTHTDITRWKQSEALIWQQANFDMLTGLPNRRMLRDRLEQDMKRSQREGHSLALMLIDLDHFKEVNDTLGHDQGDRLLVEAARRIHSCVRQTDTVARMGGDEFTVVLPALTNSLRVERIAQQIIARLNAPFQLDAECAYVSASIGIALFPTDADGIEELLKHADQALYVAKDSGRNRFSYFTPALQVEAQNRMRLANDLHSALTDHQLQVHYQPVVELATGRAVKAEALVRWQHPQRGHISPDLFVPIAESSGIIVPIGDWVFRQATAQVLRWRARYDARFQVSVNISPVQFRNSPNQVSTWIEHLKSCQLAGSAVVAEITEGLLLDATLSVSSQLKQLRHSGMQVALDDFGTGYSSLSYLQKFDIDYLKIDQAFVRDLVPGSKSLALCKAIISMAHELGMKVVAEGVETQAQCELLLAAGCDFGQGYYLAKPMPASSLDAWLSEQRSPAD
jgi:diguanylate cyclase (GGDEF)-like protein/PAS domain S-box-containing protein